jgi:hypothetical protein
MQPAPFKCKEYNMKFSALLAPLAVAATLSVSGFAFADTMVAGMNVTDAELPKVQARCDELFTSSSTMSTTEDTTAADPAAPADGLDDAPEVNGMDQATTVIDLEVLTLENCKEAGLIK